MQIKSIAILGYELGMEPTDNKYIISHFCEYWLQQGIDVKILKSVKDNVDADIIMNHIDLTVTPDDYVEFMKKFKYKINFNVQNISKKLYSQHLLSKNDNYDGKVFLKTDANCGGKFDYAFYEQLETTTKSFQPTCRYGQFLNILQDCDIGLLPLESTQFNLYKSDLKFIENAAHEVVSLASPTVYGDSIQDGVTGDQHH